MLQTKDERQRPDTSCATSLSWPACWPRLQPVWRCLSRTTQAQVLAESTDTSTERSNTGAMVRTRLRREDASICDVRCAKTATNADSASHPIFVSAPVSSPNTQTCVPLCATSSWSYSKVWCKHYLLICSIYFPDLLYLRGIKSLFFVMLFLRKSPFNLKIVELNLKIRVILRHFFVNK